MLDRETILGAENSIKHLKEVGYQKLAAKLSLEPNMLLWCVMNLEWSMYLGFWFSQKYIKGEHFWPPCLVSLVVNWPWDDKLTEQL